MKKHLNKILALALSGVSIFATVCGNNIDKSVASNPDVMACRVINSIVSQDEDEYIEIHPNSMQDDSHEFAVGLYNIVECIMCAVECGYLPKLPSSWVEAIDDIYRTKFVFDENLCYNDYDIIKNSPLANN